jgi:Uma2 family endonuclease
MGMVAPAYYSAEMVRTLPEDGNRYETVYGELLVTPAPSAWHQEVIDRLRAELRLFLSRNPVGHLFSAPADISWGSDTLVQPDLFVVDVEEARTFDWSRMQTLLLAIEVLSPSTARYDRFTKRRLYQEVGVPAYWLVDPDRKLIEVWTHEATVPNIERERLIWEPLKCPQCFELAVSNLFRPI